MTTIILVYLLVGTLVGAGFLTYFFSVEDELNGFDILMFSLGYTVFIFVGGLLTALFIIGLILVAGWTFCESCWLAMRNNIRQYISKSS